MVWLVKLISSVLPSGALLATRSAAILPPAPGRFSTTTGWPSSWDISWAMVRASVSVVPPAGAPTRIRIGLPPATWGCPWAAADSGRASAHAARLAMARRCTAARRGIEGRRVGLDGTRQNTGMATAPRLM
ncbi:hypothetical protein D3C87_1786230 [compost metagenome]